MGADTNTIVENNKAETRFQILVGDSAAYLKYELGEDSISLIHTDVPPDLEGQGLGSKIVNAALEFASSKNLQVIPQCPFVVSYIEKHPKYQKLLQT